jgi:hypothetical protein
LFSRSQNNHKKTKTTKVMCQQKSRCLLPPSVRATNMYFHYIFLQQDSIKTMTFDDNKWRFSFQGPKNILIHCLFYILLLYISKWIQLASEYCFEEAQKFILGRLICFVAALNFHSTRMLLCVCVCVCVCVYFGYTLPSFFLFFLSCSCR